MTILTYMLNLNFRHRVLRKNDPVWDADMGVNGTLFVGLANGLGAVNWELVGTLFLSWVVVYLIIWKGLHSSGKVYMNTNDTPKHLSLSYSKI